MCKRFIYLAFFVLVLGLVSSAAGGTFDKGSILFEWFDGTTGGDVDQAVDGRNPNYPDNPSESDWLTTFEGPDGRADNYMTRVRGYLYPPADGSYTFWIYSDDESRLWLSTDDDPANMSLVCEVTGWTASQEWDKFPEQKSEFVTLQAGQKYYIEAVHTEGGGGDRLGVGWEGPTIGAGPVIIDGVYLSAFIRRVDLIAGNPSPADSGECDKFWAVLGWSVGASADSHDVYFGDNFAEVDAGSGDTFRGRQSETLYLVGAGGPSDPCPGGLVPETTYYWRIDEVEDDETTIHRGNVWSFTVTGPTARNPSPGDGSEFAELDTKLSWSAGFEAIMHDVYFGTDETTVANVTTGAISQQATTYSPGTLELGKVYYWRVDEFDGKATYKGNVWSFSTRPIISIYDPNLVGWWKLDDKGTGTVIDFSGYNRDGTIHGDPQYVAGYHGDAMEFGGDPDYVNIDGYKGILRIANDNQHAFTCAAWIKTSDNGVIMNWGHTSGRQRVEFRLNGGRLRVEHGSGNIRGDTNVDDDEWHHVAAVVPEGGAMKDVVFYIDGEVDNYRTISNPDNLFNITDNHDLKLARRYNTGDRWYTGLIDDARLYDIALTQDEVKLIVLRPDPLQSWNPSPADGSTANIDAARPLSWSAGDFAVQHDVYFGIDVNSVADADASDTPGIYQGRQSATSFNPPALEYDETYYWRIDEVEADEATVHKGRVWSFTVTNFIVVEDFEDYNDWPGSRIYETWADGWEIPENGATVGYPEPLPVGEHLLETTDIHGGEQSLPYFYDNRTAAYSEATVNAANLPIGRDWTRQGVQALSLWFRGYPAFVGSFAEDPAGTYTMTARGADIWDMSDEFHFAWKQLPGPGVIIAKVENIRNTHNWAKAGVMIRDTLEPDSAHAIMVVTPASGVAFQRRTVAGAASTTTTEAGITAPQWVKIERDITGNVTASYSADGITWTELGSEIIDMSVPAYIGLALTSHHVTMSCEATFSNVQITGAVSPQWMDQSIAAINNAAEPMYVAVSSGGTPVAVYHDDPRATQIDAWTEWNIDLKDFAREGVSLANVDTFSIGFERSGVVGGSGKMYFDDIRLYRPRCIVSLLKPAAGFNNDCVVDYLDLELMAADWLQSDSVVATTAPDPNGLVAHYKLDGNADDISGNNYHGVEKGGTSYVAGKYDQALSFDGFDDYVAIQDMNYASTGHTEVSVCAWIRTDKDESNIIVSFDRNEYWRLEINGSGAGPGQVGWDVMTSSGQVDYGSGRRVDDGQWHHVAGTFDNGTLTIYIDGAPETPVLGGPTFGTGNVRYGFLGAGSEATEFNGRDNGAGSYFDGVLDDMRIYNYALSQAEIAYLADETPEDGELYIPVTSIANLYNEEPPLSRSVNFKDFAVFADMWLDEQLWPQP